MCSILVVKDCCTLRGAPSLGLHTLNPVDLAVHHIQSNAKSCCSLGMHFVMESMQSDTVMVCASVFLTDFSHLPLKSVL